MAIYVLLSLIVFGTITSLIIINIRKGISGLKLMLLGINITLLGGIIAVDPSSNLAGFEYLIVITGLIISIVGLGKDN